jgi:hypothetical protein
MAWMGHPRHEQGHTIADDSNRSIGVLNNGSHNDVRIKWVTFIGSIDNDTAVVRDDMLTVLGPAVSAMLPVLTPLLKGETSSVRNPPAMSPDVGAACCLTARATSSTEMVVGPSPTAKVVDTVLFHDR